jgi:AmpE protein
MTILSILLSLLSDRFLFEQEAYRQHRWFNRFLQWLDEVGVIPASMRQLGLLAALIPPLLVVGWLQSLFDSGIPALIFGAAILLLSLGPRDLDRQVNAFIDACESGDDGTRHRIRRELTGNDNPDQDSTAIAQGIFTQACTRLFGTLFWFLVLGPLGAALYRLSHQMRQFHTENPEQSGHLKLAGNLVYLLDWAPARVTAFSYAIAGGFEEAMQGWRHASAGLVNADNSNNAILAATGMGALHLDIGAHPDDEATPPEDTLAEAALGLTWRSLLIWLALLAGGSFLYWLG